MKQQNYRLFLYTPTGEYRGELVVDNLNVDIKLNDISSISFTIPETIGPDQKPNVRLLEALDLFEVELWYGENLNDENSVNKMRFVIYQTPLNFADEIYTYTFSGLSKDSLMETEQIVRWDGIEKFTYYKEVEIDSEIDYFENNLIVSINPNVLDEDLEVYEVRQSTLAGNEKLKITFLGMWSPGLNFRNGFFKRNGSTITIALPDNYAEFSNGKVLSYRIYDNPTNRLYPVGYTGLTQGFKTELEDILSTTEITSGDLNGYFQETYFSKDGLLLEEILDDILEQSSFSKGTISAALADRYRSNIDLNNISVYQALQDLATKYDAVMVVDTIAEPNTVSFYEDLEFGENKGLIIKYGTYLQSISKDIDATKVYTVVQGLGKDGLTATLVTPTQKNEWEDYSYYLDGYAVNEDNVNDVIDSISISGTNVNVTFKSGLQSRWMPAADAAKLSKWQITRDFYHAVLLGETSLYNNALTWVFSQLAPISRYKNLYNERQIGIREFVKEEEKLDALYAQLINVKTIYEYAKNSLERGETQFTSTNVSDYKERFEEIEENYSDQLEINKETECEIFNTNCSDTPIDTLYLKFEEISGFLDKSNFGIQSSYKKFRKTHTLNESSIDDDFELLDAMTEYSKEHRYPKVDITIDIIDLLAAQEVKSDKNKLKIGEKINVYFPEFNIDLEAQIKEISIDFDSNRISLVISTSKNYNRPFNETVFRIIKKLTVNNNNLFRPGHDDTNLGLEGARDVNEITEETTKINIAGGQNTTEGDSTVELNEEGLISYPVELDPVLETFTKITSDYSVLNSGGLFVTKEMVDENENKTGETVKVQVSADAGIAITKNDGQGNTEREFYVDPNDGSVYIKGDLNLITPVSFYSVNYGNTANLKFLPSKIDIQGSDIENIEIKYASSIPSDKLVIEVKKGTETRNADINVLVFSFPDPGDPGQTLTTYVINSQTIDIEDFNLRLNFSSLSFTLSDFNSNIANKTDTIEKQTDEQVFNILNILLNQIGAIQFANNLYTGDQNILVNNQNYTISLNENLLGIKQIKLKQGENFNITQNSTDIITIYDETSGGQPDKKIEIKNGKTHISDLDFGFW